MSRRGVRDRFLGVPESGEDFGETLYRALEINPGARLGLDGFTLPASAGQRVEPLLEWSTAG